MNKPDINTSLQAIRDRFLRLLEERQDEIHRNIEVAVRTPNKARDALACIEAVLHKIAGTAGTLGFHELGQQARDVENNIIALLHDPSVGRQDVYLEIIAFLDAASNISELAA